MIIEEKIYDGSIIHNRFAYRYFRDKVLANGNIIAFRAPAKVETEFMIDLEDVLKNDFIYSDDMVHFCWEIPCTNLFGGVCFQRLFNTYIGDILGSIIDKQIQLEGDDIYIMGPVGNAQGLTLPKGKASVSICTEVNGAVLGHTGINICAGRQAPNHAVGTHMNEKQTHQFMQKVIGAFYQTTRDIFIATTKII